MSEKPLWRMVAGRKLGPYEPAKLRPLMKDGRIGPLDRFSYDGVAWRPPGDFPELLRPPPVEEPSPLDDDDISVPWNLSPDQDEPPPLVGPRPVPRRQDESADDAAILKAVYWLVSLGAGFFLLLLTIIVVRSFRGIDRPRPPVPAARQQAPAVPRPAKQLPPPGEDVDDGAPPREDGEGVDEPTGPRPDGDPIGGDQPEVAVPAPPVPAEVEKEIEN